MAGVEHDDLLSLSEAARRSGVPRSRLRRHLDGGDLPGAHRATGPDGTPGAGPWLIPAAALTTIDLEAAEQPGDQPPDPPGPEPADLPGAPPGDEPAVEGDPADAGPMVDWLRAEVERWRRRAEVAEAQARERQTHIVDLQRALAALESAVDRPPGPAPPPGTPDRAPAQTVRPDRIVAVPPAPHGTPPPLPDSLPPRATWLQQALRRRGPP